MNLEVHAPAPSPAPPLWANTGGPSSRTRNERVRATLLGNTKGHVGCPRVLRVALWFDLLDPVDLMAKILRREGFSDPEELRHAFAIPSQRLIASILPEDTPRLDARHESPRAVLEKALLLGLCTQHLYDPSRPVLWTTASLRRGLELFAPAGFYA